MGRKLAKEHDLSLYDPEYLVKWNRTYYLHPDFPPDGWTGEHISFRVEENGLAIITLFRDMGRR